MKLFQTLLALPLLGNVAFAAPTVYPYPEDISISQSPSAEGIAQAELERRSPTCKAIMKKLWNGPYIEVAYALPCLISILIPSSGHMVDSSFFF